MTNLLRQLSPVRRHAGGLHAFAVEMARGTRMDGHRHDAPTIVILLRGELHVTEGGEEVVETTGTVRLSAPGVSRTLRTIDDAECLIISCHPSHAVARHVIWRRVCASRSSRYRAERRRIALLERAAVAECSTPDFEAVCLDFLTTLVQRDDTARSAPVWLDHALTTLMETAGQKGACRAAAHAVGVHPVHLARVVRRFTGLTVRDYLRRERIVQASRVLRSSEQSLSHVAHHTGFADHSHFTREFVRRHGDVPSAARRSDIPDVVSVQASDIPAVHLGRLSDSQRAQRGEPEWDGEEHSKA